MITVAAEWMWANNNVLHNRYNQLQNYENLLKTYFIFVVNIVNAVDNHIYIYKIVKLGISIISLTYISIEIMCNCKCNQLITFASVNVMTYVIGYMYQLITFASVNVMTYVIGYM